ncbi:Uncharacterised protein [Mycobacterium tuberculosis]|uniref:Uncharacterized protein n=1 Tax=Mycobacterium tuberculosis TaxID=1773 RepID=A0A654TWG3_MYCTX|nr:Uncharacterised protein [Mycobacterium tuberculosis]
MQLHGHGVTVDTAQHFGEASALSIAELGRRADLRDDFAAASHRNFGQEQHRFLNCLTPQQLDGVRQQRDHDRVDGTVGTLKHLAQQPDSAFGRNGTVTQQDGKPGLHVENAGKPE